MINTFTRTNEAEQIFEWRKMQFEALGLNSTDAMLAALDSEIELRKVEKLVNAGCPATTAIKIVS